MIKPMHDSHVTRQQLAVISDRLDGKGERFASADDYYNHKDRARLLSAKLANTSVNKIDPMGHWFDMQSN